MAISVENNYLTTLFNTGNDAQSNLYTVSISGGGLDDMTTALMIRADGFTEPQVEQQSYDTRFLIAKVSRPRAKVNVTKTFSITFRVDANYLVYQALQDKANMMANANSTNHAVNVDVELIKADNMIVQVDALIGDKSLTMGKYKYCWVTSIDPVAFKQGTSDPLSVKATFYYLEHEDVQSSAIKESLQSLKDVADAEAEAIATRNDELKKIAAANAKKQYDAAVAQHSGKPASME